MRSLEEIKAMYIKAITATINEHGNYEDYTRKQQKILFGLKSSIGSLGEKNLNKDFYRNKVNSWIDNIAYRFAKDIYNLLECFEDRDMDHSYGDGTHTKGNRDYYDVLIPTEDLSVFSYVGLTLFSDWNQRI